MPFSVLQVYAICIRIKYSGADSLQFHEHIVLFAK